MRTLARRALVVIIASIAALASPGVLGQSSSLGRWQVSQTTVPINPVHVALLNNGKVLIVSGSGYVDTNNDFENGLWDPAHPADQILTQPVAWDMFCNGMVVLPDGRVFIAGGNLAYNPFIGEPRTSVFDPATNTFTDGPSMAHGRWYPTVTTLGDGRVMTFSGLTETGGTNTAVEIFTPGTGWSQEYEAGWTPPLYPRMHLLPNGTVFYSGSGTGSRTFNPSTHTWSGVIANTISTITRTYGTSVLLPLSPADGYKPRVMIMGGDDPATNTTEIIDLSAASPNWQQGPPMSQPRVEMNATILPNGKVLATGGSRNDEDATTASLNADLFDPTTGTFSSAGANAFPRLYHSNALLLPDATVALIGGNPQQGTYERRIEIYSPGYLFDTNNNPVARPTIAGVPVGPIPYNAGFQVQTPDAADITSVVLVRPGAPTHAFDMDQRLVQLVFTTGSGVLNVTTPPNGNIAPPGYYMLFILNHAGVPSGARFVQLMPGAAPAITSANNTTFTVGTAGSFTVTTTGSPAPTLSKTGALPSGVTFVNNGNGTATLSGTPAAGTAGTYALTITANNGVAPAATQNFTLTVSSGGGGGGGTFAYVTGSVTGIVDLGGDTAATLSTALHQSPGAGHLLVCAATWQSATATAAMSDPNNGTWTPIGTARTGVGSLSGYRGQMFYMPAAANAATTVTLTLSSAVAFRAFECAEYSYTGTIAAPDGTPQYSTTPAASGVATVTGLTTTKSNDLVFADCLAVDTTCTAGTGFTGLDDPTTVFKDLGTTGSFSSGTGQLIEFKVGVGAGAQSATFRTGTAADNVILGLVALTAANNQQAPTITSANNATFTVGTAGSFMVTSTGTPTPSITKTGTLPTGVTFVSNANGTATLSGTPASGTAGTYALTFTASNGVGTPANQSFTLTVVQTSQAPAITSANNTTFTVGTAGSFTVTTTGSPAPTLSKTGALPSGVTFVNNGNGTATLSGTPAAGTAGTYALTITANNGVAPAATQNFTLTVSSGGGGGGGTFAYVTGSVTGIVDLGGDTAATLSTALHQSPGAGHLLVCAATWQSATATAAMSDPNNGTWTPIGTARTGVGSLSGYRGQMFYMPAAANAATTVTLTLSSAVAFRAFECAEYSYTGTIAAPDGTPQYSTTPAASGVATVTGLTTTKSNDLVFADCLAVDTTCTAGTGFTGLDDPTTVFKDLGTTGSFSSGTGQLIEFKVGVGAGAQSATFRTGPADNVILGLVALTAANNQQAPTITSANNATFTVGTAGSFMVTSTGTPTPSITKTGTLPTGVTFVSNANGTATLSGTPASGTAGTYALTFTASNGVGTPANQSFTLTVVQTSQAPAITSANNTTFTVGTAGSFTVTTTGSPAPTLSKTGALPSGVTFVNNGNGTATLSGTPAAGTAGTYALTITANNGVAPAATQNFTLTVSSGGGGGGGTFAYVTGSVTGIVDLGGDTAATLSTALHQSPGAGHLLVCAATWQSATATAAMSDPNNGTWTPIGTARTGVGSLSGYRGQMFYMPAAANAATTVTLTLSSAVAFRAFECAEYSYTGTIAAPDGTPQYSTTPAASGVATVTGLTTTKSNDLVFADCLAVDTTCTAGTGFTGLDDPTTVFKDLGTTGSFSSGTGQLIEFKVGVGAGAQSATFRTGTAADNVILGLVAF